MSQTSCERSGFPVPMRWLRAGGDLFRPDSTHQCPDRALMRSETPADGPPTPFSTPAPADKQVKSYQRHVYHRARRPHQIFIAPAA
jgi:hypothetical protein